MSIISASINLTKLDKSAFFKNENGTFADISLMVHDDGPDQYGNHAMVVQDLGKERRMAGEKGPILGNAKWVAGGPGPSGGGRRSNRSESDTSKEMPPATEDDDEIPF